MPTSEERRISIRLTDEQFRLLFDTYPNDPEFQAEVCRQALYEINVPNPTGRTQSGIRVYVDNGYMGSGYVLVHWDDAKKLDWCLDNGYAQNGFPAGEEPIIWDENPERERLMSIKSTLSDWAYG